MGSASPNPDAYPYQSEASWSGPEKTIARKVFDDALKRELQDVIQKAKQMAGQIREPAELWDLEQYLSERRKEIDRKYDYRYSRLAQVFGRLLYENRVSEEELRGLSDDKLKLIHSAAEFMAKYAA